MTDPMIEELRALDAAATQGPWTTGDAASVHMDSRHTWHLRRDGVPGICLTLIAFAQDADLIAAMRNALPQLLAAAEEAERLRASFDQRLADMQSEFAKVHAIQDRQIAERKAAEAERDEHKARANLAARESGNANDALAHALKERDDALDSYGIADMDRITLQVEVDRLRAERNDLHDQLSARLDDLRAERDRLQAAVDAVRALCDKHEHGALRWAEPLDVPAWIPLVRAALNKAKTAEATSAPTKWVHHCAELGISVCGMDDCDEPRPS